LPRREGIPMKVGVFNVDVEDYTEFLRQIQRLERA
jgi:hypothetical protein